MRENIRQEIRRIGYFCSVAKIGETALSVTRVACNSRLNKCACTAWHVNTGRENLPRISARNQTAGSSDKWLDRNRSCFANFRRNARHKPVGLFVTSSQRIVPVLMCACRRARSASELRGFRDNHRFRSCAFDTKTWSSLVNFIFPFQVPLASSTPDF